VPESFHVLIKELQSLGLDVDLLEEKPISKAENSSSKRKSAGKIKA
jgi:hypothetical protein